MEQNDQPTRAKSMQELVLEQLERERLEAQMRAARNTGGLGGLMNQGILGQISAGSGLYSGGVSAADWQNRAYQMDAMDRASKDAAIANLTKLNRELQQRIEMLEKMLAHPDRQAIQSIDSLIENVNGQEVYRAGAPFTAKQVFAEILKKGEHPKTIKLMDREGRERVGVVTGVTIVTGSPETPVAYYLANIKMDEMNKKQVITDLVASIIEDRVMESIEEK